MNQTNDQGRQHGIWVFPALLLGLIPQAIAEAAITASLPEIARDLGVNGEFAAQMVLGAAALGLVLGALVSGRVLEKLGARSTMVLALVAFGLAGTGGFFLHTPVQIIASRIVVGFSASCIATTCLWGIRAEFDGQARARLFGLAGACAALSAIVSVILGGFLTQTFGWRQCFLIFPAFALLALPLAFVGIRPARPEPASEGHVGGYFGRMIPLFALVLILWTLIGMGGMQFSFLLDESGLNSAGVRAMVLGVPGIGAMIGAALFGPTLNRLGAAWTLTLCLMALCLGLAVPAYATNVPLFVAGAFFNGFCMGMNGPYFYHATGERVAIGSSGRFMGYITAFTFLGVFLNPLIFEPIKSQLGTRNVFLLGAVVAFVMVIGGIVSALRKPEIPDVADTQ